MVVKTNNIQTSDLKKTKNKKSSEDEEIKVEKTEAQK